MTAITVTTIDRPAAVVRGPAIVVSGRSLTPAEDARLLAVVSDRWFRENFAGVDAIHIKLAPRDA